MSENNQTFVWYFEELFTFIIILIFLTMFKPEKSTSLLKVILQMTMIWGFFTSLDYVLCFNCFDWKTPSGRNDTVHSRHYIIFEHFS